jgi:hypothetical protein
MLRMTWGWILNRGGSKTQVRRCVPPMSSAATDRTVDPRSAGGSDGAGGRVQPDLQAALLVESGCKGDIRSTLGGRKVTRCD